MTKQKSDLGSEDLSRHRTVRVEAADLTGTPRARVVDECTADYILLKGWISIPEYDTLIKLRGDIHQAGLSGVRASDYQPRVASGNNQNISTEQAVKRMVVNDAILWMDRRVGTTIRKLVIDIGMDVWDVDPRQMPDLKKGIASLSSFYGL